MNLLKKFFFTDPQASFLWDFSKSWNKGKRSEGIQKTRLLVPVNSHLTDGNTEARRGLKAGWILRAVEAGKVWSPGVVSGLCAEEGKQNVRGDGGGGRRGRTTAVRGVCFLPSGQPNKSWTWLLLPAEKLEPWVWGCGGGGVLQGNGRMEAQLLLCSCSSAQPLLAQPLVSLLGAPRNTQPQRHSHPGGVFNTPLPPPLPSDSVLGTYQNTVTSQIRYIFSFLFFVCPKLFEEFYFNRTLLLKLTMLWLQALWYYLCYGWEDPCDWYLDSWFLWIEVDKKKNEMLFLIKSSLSIYNKIKNQWYGLV